MKTKNRNSWVLELGYYLTREILDEMAAIRLECQNAPPKAAGAMDTVCCKVDGAYQMQIFFRAEQKLFRRLAANMIGESSEIPDELVQEYAKEVVNTLTGRFISEIYHMTKIPARFYPVEYKKSEEFETQEKCEALYTIWFISDKQECAEFSWSKMPMEELLKRSERR